MSRRIVILSVTLLVVAGLVVLILRDTGSEPYSVPRNTLSGWTLGVGGTDEPWIAGLRPPVLLTKTLLEQLSDKAGARLSDATPTLPLVMRDEYADGLQGVHSVENILRFARDAGLESAPFQPVCLARHTRGERASGELYFVVFEASAFRDFRQDIIPAFPEHAGTGIYDSGGLLAILPIAVSEGSSNTWWPIAFDQARDCVAQIFVE
jgi:hypothetical protein